MSRSTLLGMILLAATAWSQTTPNPTVEATHYPAVIHAEIPLYPSIARAANISGTVEIRVVVEKGAVVDAQVKSVVIASHNGPTLTDEGKKKIGLYLSNPSLTNVKSWQFDPDDHATFLLRYVYRIAGEPTSLYENPLVEFDLPVVRITAKPLKPICQDCGANINGISVR